MSLSLCPSCRTSRPSVIDSRSTGDGTACRRRYKCVCGIRFTTYEIVIDEKPGTGWKKEKGRSVALGAIAAQRIVGDSYDPM